MTARQLPPQSPLDSRESRKRRREWIAIGVLLALFAALTLAEFRLTRLSNTLPFVNSIFFFGILNFNIILLIALIWLVFRNIGKVLIERRRRVLGSRLKTKLVLALISFAIVPTVLLFIISALYINSSFDKWFSIKIQNTFEASLEITATYYKNAEQNATHFAEHIARQISRREGDIQKFLNEQRDLLAIDSAEFYRAPLDERVLSRKPGTLEEDFPRLPLDTLQKAFAGDRVAVIQHFGQGDLIRTLVPIRDPEGEVVGVVVVNSATPVSLSNKVDEIASVLEDYKVTNPLKYPMKTTYLVILSMMTLVILFVAIWVGLYLARELTIPVERLVKGSQAVGAGDLDFSIVATGDDELTVLVSSFNKMTRDLKENRERLTQASADLERRTLQLETILANVGTGVMATDAEGVVTHFNRIAENIFGVLSTQVVGRPFPAEYSEPLASALARAIGDDFPIQTFQWVKDSPQGQRTLNAVITALHDSSGKWGSVAVIDDITMVIKGQREMAWREVARRIAHEIKNPLTPIKLSAQRLQRRLNDFTGKDGQLIKECTDTIIRYTDDLKEMVNEFSNFARFPEISPSPNDLNHAVTEVSNLYYQAHPTILFESHLEPRLPVFNFDKDQIKRVLINLFDNAVAAVSALPPDRPRRVYLATHYNEEIEMAAIEVSDSGNGIPEDLRERIFEPYFSTKKDGTGLGLAIAKRIVNDHNGFIRVYSNAGSGARFLIELPISRGLLQLVRPPRDA